MFALLSFAQADPNPKARNSMLQACPEETKPAVVNWITYNGNIRLRIAGLGTEAETRFESQSLLVCPGQLLLIPEYVNGDALVGATASVNLLAGAQVTCQIHFVRDGTYSIVCQEAYMPQKAVEAQ